MKWIFIAIGIFLFYKLVIRFFIDRHNENRFALEFLPQEVRDMIKNSDADGLARLIVALKIQGREQDRNLVIKAVDSKGVVFSSKVDKLRNKYRLEAGIEPLRKF